MGNSLARVLEAQVPVIATNKNHTDKNQRTNEELKIPIILFTTDSLVSIYIKIPVLSRDNKMVPTFTK